MSSGIMCLIQNKQILAICALYICYMCLIPFLNYVPYTIDNKLCGRPHGNGLPKAKARKEGIMRKEELLTMTPEERQQIIERAINARHVRNTTPEQIKVATRAAEKIAAGFRVSVEEFEALTGVMFSHHMTGKMLNILSLSTNCFCNPCCIARMLAGIGICAECFAAGVEAQYSGTFENTAYNSMILSASVLPLEVLPIIDADELRIESFGDTANWKQAANYMNLARVNPLLPVTAWTKNPGHYAEAIRRGYTKPHNFTLIFSSIELNNPADIKPEFESIIDKRFTVYTLDWLDNNGLDHRFINCGGRSCKNCQRCYKNAASTGFDVRELLKKDADKARKTRGGNWETWEDETASPEVKPEGVRRILAMFGK